MANDKNLIPLGDRDKDTAKKIRSAGGKACQAKKKQKKEFAEWVKIIGEMDVPPALSDKMKILFPDSKDLTFDALIHMAMYKEAVSGNVGAFRAIAEAQGKIPQHQQDQMESDGLSKALENMAKELDDNG